MQKNDFIKNNRTVLLSYLLLVVFILSLRLFIEKLDLHRSLNQYNYLALDHLYSNITHTGAFPLIFFVILLTTFWKFRIALAASISTAFASILTQIGKRLLWTDEPRPIVFFKHLDDFHVVEGIRLHTSHSFPSGHSTGVFALCMLLAFFLPKQSQKLLCLLVAALGAYSRVYLSQHFIEDVLAGSFIGVVGAMVAYFLFTSHRLQQHRWMDLSLRDLLPTKMQR